MFVLRAFPLSFSILWRFAIVLPILIIALAALGVLAFIFTLFFALISPLLSMLIIVGFGVGASVVPVMVGMRLGLQAFEVRPKNTYLGVMIAAVGYGLFEAFAVLLIIGLALGAFFLASPLTMEELGAVASQGEGETLQALLDASPVLTIAGLAAVGFLALGLRAALLVPFAGASIGADPNGRTHTPFFAFGDGFFGLLFLVVFVYIGWVLVIPVAVLICAALGFGDSLALAMAEAERMQPGDISGLLGLEVAVFLGICLVLYLWLASLVCAGAVLRFRRLQEGVVAQQRSFDRKMEEHLSEPAGRSRDVDMLELIRSRMPDKKY